MLALFIAIRIVANPVSNVFQKQLTQRRGVDPLVIIACTHALLSVFCLPWWVMRGGESLPMVFWMNIAFAALLAVCGNVLLVYALRVSDLSILGPVNAYKSVLSLLLGAVMIGEVPTAVGLGGVLLIVAGSLFVTGGTGGVRFFGDRGVQLRIAALGCSATEAVYLKKALLVASPEAAFVFWSLLGVPIASAALWLLQRTPDRRAILADWKTYAMLAFTTGLMQLSTLLTFGKFPVGYSLALFQLSTLLSVLLGYRIFHEGHLARRLTGSLIMIGGALCIAFGG